LSRNTAIPEPYTFLEYVNQGTSVALSDTVRGLTQAERSVGFWTRLTEELSTTSEWMDLARDLGALWPFLFQAANDGYAVYYREDAT